MSIRSVVNLSTRQDKIQEPIELIGNDKKAQDIAKAIHFQDIFPFTYNVWEFVEVTSNFPDSRHDINDFKLGAIVAIEFEILSHNFKASKHIDVVKA